MSRLNHSTKQRIKEQILRSLNSEAKTARAISQEINRSWNLTSRLLVEIEDEHNEVLCTKIGSIKAYVIKQPLPSLQETAESHA